MKNSDQNSISPSVTYSPSKVTRRDILKQGMALAGLSAIASNSSAAILTPRATEGPFYPKPSMRFDDIDNNLVKVEPSVTQAGGEVIYLSGKILDRDGNPLAGQRIEIWQCDVNGKYMHPWDRRSVEYDSGFQGFGHDITDSEGNYSFVTIKPTKYPGRTPHIHVKILDASGERLTTQIYIDGHPDNNRDGIFRRLSREQAKSVSMVFDYKRPQTATQIDFVV